MCSAQKRTFLGEDRGFTIANAMDTQRDYITTDIHPSPIPQPEPTVVLGRSNLLGKRAATKTSGRGSGALNIASHALGFG